MRSSRWVRLQEIESRSLLDGLPRSRRRRACLKTSITRLSREQQLGPPLKTNDASQASASIQCSNLKGYAGGYFEYH